MDTKQPTENDMGTMPEPTTVENTMILSKALKDWARDPPQLYTPPLMIGVNYDYDAESVLEEIEAECSFHPGLSDPKVIGYSTIVGVIMVMEDLQWLAHDGRIVSVEIEGYGVEFGDL